MSQAKNSQRLRGRRAFPWRSLRITVLAFVLLLTALSAWVTKARTASWERSLWVAIYPINADGSDASARYISALDLSAFEPIDTFFRREAGRYSFRLPRPVDTHLYQPIANLPPPLPVDAGPVGTMWWSIKLRYWAWQVTHSRNEAIADARIFVLYHDPDLTPDVPHSLGLQKGMLGIVYAFAARRATAPNDVVIAHELMHTLGATDKYDPATDMPSFPAGYAEPDRRPLFPQLRTEIMAGRMMISATSWVMPESLAAVVMGPQSAREIHWER